MNEKQVILAYTKIKFETDLYMGLSKKRKSYLINQIIFYPWLDKKVETTTIPNAFKKYFILKHLFFIYFVCRNLSYNSFN